MNAWSRSFHLSNDPAFLWYISWHLFETLHQDLRSLAIVCGRHPRARLLARERVAVEKSRQDLLEPETSSTLGLLLFRAALRQPMRMSPELLAML